MDRMLKKFAQDDEDERQKEENRNKFRQCFMTEARQQRIERHTLLQQEREKENREQEVMKQREEQREHMIEEAKRLLLAKHASQLDGFLPKI